jgi:hypothetical protein
MARKKLTIAKGDDGQGNLTNLKPTKKVEKMELTQPYMESIASDFQGDQHNHDTRRNVAGIIERTNRFANIDNGLVPFRYSSSIYGANRSSIDVRDAVVLCQKCYYNFALFRNVIDLMTEFSVGRLILRGGSQQSRDFFHALWRKINMEDFQERWYREYYRSGNVFTYRFDAIIKPADVQKIIQAFAAENNYDAGQQKAASYIAEDTIVIKPDKLTIEPFSIPARYLILNPADIQMMSTLNFAYGIYFKILTDYEIARLRNPVTEEDIAVFKDLPDQVQKQIKTGSRVVAIPLDEGIHGLL